MTDFSLIKYLSCSKFRGYNLTAELQIIYAIYSGLEEDKESRYRGHLSIKIRSREGQ